MRLLYYAILPLIVVLCIPNGARAQARSGNPYTLQQIVELVQGGWSSADILSMVRGECISFRVTSATEAELRRAGAEASLLTGLRSVCNRAGGNQPARTTQTRTPARGIVLIEGELPPGWFRTVNGAFKSDNRTIELTLPGRLIEVSAPGWCPDRIEVTLRPGEERRWTPTLRARPWIGDC